MPSINVPVVMLITLHAYNVNKNTTYQRIIKLVMPTNVKSSMKDVCNVTELNVAFVLLDID